MKWQPIETAPKDGTIILVADKGVYVARIAQWDKGMLRSGGGWLDAWNSDNVEPTHWMPLPDVPKRK